MCTAPHQETQACMELHPMKAGFMNNHSLGGRNENLNCNYDSFIPNILSGF